MLKHTWERVWKEKKFKIKTLTPSVLVKQHQNNIQPGDYILDVGCGNGRNSIYLAERGCIVDCFDVADLKWRNNSSQKKVRFFKTSINKFYYPTNKYKAVIITRVIQYLTRAELSFLVEKAALSLKKDGFLLLNFTAKGGIFKKKEIDVPKFSHTKIFVEKLLKNKFEIVRISRGLGKSKHVNYHKAVLTYDIFASDPKLFS